ncbi:uncharacterized protein G2W53_037882 [Senna tora]|uniref:Uncharacterized protein n=1 Tax=Senna tora TaxID=362788 RepID=A0A834SLW1_9FABA|nr:uncharacterized protein G2W53_037882 [Senna tora]
MMAFAQFVTLLLVFALAETRLEVASASQILKAKVSCFDCTTHNYDLSEMKVSVKCENVKKLAVASTEEDGSFKVELPTKSDIPKCVAQVIGGAKQVYGSRKHKVSLIVKAKEGNTYTTSTPLGFLTSCPKHTNCIDQFGSSKTIDFPLPPQWGLAPSSYYIPFFPIIGIP